MNKRLSKLLVILMCISSCFACAKNSKSKTTTYKNFYVEDITTLNYITTNEYYNIIHIANLIDGLVEHDKYGNIVPSIANKWSSKIVNNKQIWMFYLKDNVHWTDFNGNKYDLVTAHDFVTTLKYSLNYSFKSENNSLATNLIYNAKNYYYGTLIKNYNLKDVENKILELANNDPNNQLLFYTNIKSAFDYCYKNNACTDSFDQVGVKALDDLTLEFTLNSPTPYFLSVLTNNTFLPTSEKFIKEIGFNNFGTNRKNILYNGGYILTNYAHSSRIEYTKNKNYWDKDNIFIDKLIFIKSQNYPSLSYSRLAYESGNIDEFYVNEFDKEGWEKYVTGKSKAGSFDYPLGNNTYTSIDNSSFNSFYLIFNQNRINTSLTSLTKEELTIANKALGNVNFRKSLFYGIDTRQYFNNNSNTLISTLIPNGFLYYNNIDYTNYYIQTFATKNNISFEESYTTLNNNLLFDCQKSNYYLDLALQELEIPESNLPIKIEFTYYFNEESKIYDKERIKNWNKYLNGCSPNDEICDYDKVMIIFNEAVDSQTKYNTSFLNKEYNISFIGLYPDFPDPSTYLNSFIPNGDLASYINHNSAPHIVEMLEEANTYYKEEDIETRLRLYSEVEYYILMEECLILPLYLNVNKQIIVSNLVPYQRMKANYGLSLFKFKHRKKISTPLTQKDIAKLKEEYEKGVIK